MLRYRRYLEISLLAACCIQLVQAPAASTVADLTTPADTLHPALERRLRDAGHGGRVKAWVLVREDKGFADPEALEGALASLERSYDPRATHRRALRRTRPGLFDVDDLPLPEAWLAAVRASGAEIVVESRWAPGVSVRATRGQLSDLAALPFVEALRPVLRGHPRDRFGPRPDADGTDAAPAGPASGAVSAFYGEADAQLRQIGLIALHDLGYTGAGVRVGVLDTGFRRTHLAFNDPSHPLDVVAEFDFVDNDPNTAPEAGDAFNQHEHGTLILGAIGAYQPNVLVGSAFDASFILAKVEDVAAEYPLEEDWFAAGLEFIEQNGGDLATSSVVIFDHYTQQQNDGQTSVMARAVNTATDNGLHVCQGVGNNGHDADPATSTLVTPADAFKAVTVGSVDNTGTSAPFTSDGPTADGRQKPEVLARGVNTRTVSPWFDDQTDGRDGASMATPLVCGAAAALVEAHPAWTVDQLRTHLFLHGDTYLATGAPDPLFVRGFGVVDVRAAYDEDCNANTVADPADLVAGTSGDCNANGIPDECDVDALTSADDAADGLPDECSECRTGPGCPGEVTTPRVDKQFPDLLLSWDATANASAYSVRRDATAASAGSSGAMRGQVLA